jgi:CRISPR-associated endonuclease Csn1
MRADLLPYSKYKKLLQKEVKTDEFVSRQLVDTAYITKVTGEYLKCLFDADHHVLGLKGALTAELRWQWGLETVLESLPDSPAWQTKSDLRPGEKNRADHRHHAIDAVVIALTNRSRLQALAKSMSDVNNNREGELLDEPWPKFRDTIVDRVSRVWVSHRVERKIRGALHEETQYGKTDQEDCWVYRKSIDALSSNEVASIRDPFIRDMIISRLKEFGIDVGRNTDVDTKKIKEALVGLKMPSGVPIRKVRILKKEQTITAIRRAKSETFVRPGSNHHLAIFEWTEKGKKKRDAVFAPMIDAINRVKNGREIIDRSPPAEHSTIPSDAKFLMTLSTREAILIEDSSGQRLLIYRSGKSTTKQMSFVEHSDARKYKSAKEVSFKPSTIKGRKVTVDYLGRIRNAND